MAWMSKKDHGKLVGLCVCPNRDLEPSLTIIHTGRGMFLRKPLNANTGSSYIKLKRSLYTVILEILVIKLINLII